MYDKFVEVASASVRHIAATPCTGCRENNAPSGWPVDITYLSQNESRTDFPPCALQEDAELEIPVHDVLSSPHYPVTIQRITDTTHPVVNMYGLFALASIPPNVLVCNYIGRIYLQSDVPDSDYAVTYYQNYVLDSTFAGNEARFINDYRKISSRPNVAFDTYRDNSDGQIQVGVWTLNKTISPGEEILGNYGKQYWRHRGVKGPLGPDWDDDWDNE